MELKDITKEAVIISEDATYGEALDMMLEKHTNTLLVSGEGSELVGEVSVSDLFDGMIPLSEDGDAAMSHFKDEASFKEALHKAKETPVSEFMSADYSALTLNDNLMSIAATAIAHERARIPVVDHDEHPIGIISRQGLKQILDKFINNK